MPPLLADFTHARPCKPFCEKYLTLPSTSIAAQVDSIHIDIRITPTLQRTVPPILNVDIRFLVQLTNGGGKDFAAP